MRDLLEATLKLKTTMTFTGLLTKNSNVYKSTVLLNCFCARPILTNQTICACYRKKVCFYCPPFRSHTATLDIFSSYTPMPWYKFKSLRKYNWIMRTLHLTFLDISWFPQTIIRWALNNVSGDKFVALVLKRNFYRIETLFLMFFFLYALSQRKNELFFFFLIKAVPKTSYLI